MSAPPGPPGMMPPPMPPAGLMPPPMGSFAQPFVARFCVATCLWPSIHPSFSYPCLSSSSFKDICVVFSTWVDVAVCAVAILRQLSDSRKQTLAITTRLRALEIYVLL
eukprot:m.79884 g.79884  ORF g.79884 m.79884 type:complete len:108 (-) comp50674_c0_seq1:1597-1920(-)